MYMFHLFSILLDLRRIPNEIIAVYEVMPVIAT
jgi:hypothetical protein